jgi:hypothetical protein
MAVAGVVDGGVAETNTVSPLGAGSSIQEVDMEMKPLRNHDDYQAALAAIETLWSAPEGSPEVPY